MESNNERPYSDTRSISVNVHFPHKGSQSNKSLGTTSQQFTQNRFNFTQIKNFGGKSRFEELAKNSDVSIDQFYKSMTKSINQQKSLKKKTFQRTNQMVAVQAAMTNQDTPPRSISKLNIQEASITEENNAYSDERKKNSARS